MIKLLFLCLISAISPSHHDFSLKDAIQSIRPYEAPIPTTPKRPLFEEKEKPQNDSPKAMIEDPFPFLRPDYPFWLHYQNTPFPVEIPKFHKSMPLE